MRPVSRVRTITVVFVLLSPVAVAAQGNGHGHAYGLNKNQGSAPSAAGAPVVTPAGPVAARHFGSWLDDATVLPEGKAALSFGFRVLEDAILPGVRRPVRGWHRGSDQTRPVRSEPAVLPRQRTGRSAGAWRRRRVSQLEDPAARSVDRRASGGLRDCAGGRGPELSTGAWSVASELGLPLNVELQREGWRVYGSTGYFSRGSVFASGAVELALSDRAWLTGTLSQSHVVNHKDAIDALGLARTRTDVSGGSPSR